MNEWTLIIPVPSPLKNEIAHLHWSALRKLKRDWYYRIRSAMGTVEIPKATGYRSVTITRYSVGSPDPDGIIYGAAACIVDNLRPAKVEAGTYKSGKRKGQFWRKEWLGHGLILDDAKDKARIEYRQVRVSDKAEARTEIEIQDGGAF